MDTIVEYNLTKGFSISVICWSPESMAEVGTVNLNLLSD